MQLNHHHRYLIEEFAEDYLNRRLGRRDLLRKVLLLTGSIPLTGSVLFALGCGSSDGDDGEPAPAAQLTPTQAPAAVHTSVPETDPAIEGADVRFAGPASELLGYVARPKAAGTYPGIIVIHENRGISEHFRDVARRYAKQGYAALAVDLLSRQGGTSTNASQNTAGLRDTNALITDLVANAAYLKSQPFVKADALGVTGFCLGGNFTWELAMASADLKAAVPYYGTVDLNRLGELKSAAVLAIYGANDARITAQSTEVESRLKAAGKTVEIKVYPGAGHAFFNDTGNAYNAEAAADAWTTSLAWFRRYLV